MNIGALVLYPFRNTKWCKRLIHRQCNKHFEQQRIKQERLRDERMGLGMYSLLLGNGKRFEHARSDKTVLALNVSLPWRRRMYMTDEEIHAYLNEHGDMAFENLPVWLREELKSRRLTWPNRVPTTQEFFDTIEDGRVHRVTNQELEIQDLQNFYLHGKSGSLRPY